MGFQSETLSQSVAAINSFCQFHPFLLAFCMFVLGTCVGSFLNVLALRSLKEESLIFPSSYCPQCNHALAAWDNIPLLSYLILGGKCRYCRQDISWQYPLVELATGIIYALLAYLFLHKTIFLAGFDTHNLFLPTGREETHDLFQAIARALAEIKGGVHLSQTLDSPDLAFYKYGLFIGLLVFASTLIAVTVTDFREKLIPHEITYPSMLFGIAFSAAVRNDFAGAMIGVGISYIFFDFMAFYGQKVYMMTQRPDEDGAASDAESVAPEYAEMSSSLTERALAEEEPVEVMGGGDAVLSAVMSAYLGWQLLSFSLIIGFAAGTIMGLVLLVVEMKKFGLLRECGQKSLKWGLTAGLICGAVMGSLTLCLGLLGISGFEESKEFIIKNALGIALYTGSMGFIGGALIGVILVGRRVSKPFPFGPSLALGGFIAMFLIPYWLPFY